MLILGNYAYTFIEKSGEERGEEELIAISYYQCASASIFCVNMCYFEMT